VRQQAAAKMSNTAVVSQPVSIRAEISLADGDTCRFIVSCMVYPGGPFLFSHQKQAAGSPLGERLFAVPGVATVLIAENVITVCKQSTASWSDMKAAIGATIRAQIQSGVPAILDMHAHLDNAGRSDDELHTIIQELLDQDINRSIASHGGKISIVNIEHGKLYINMSGGCQGCASSQVTLRQGFEVMVKKVAPEIIEIIDTTNHAAGKKPFYPKHD
jgi:Fe-S cluster biogenesis protein NfuA